MKRNRHTMAHIRLVTPNERWFNREVFSEDGGMERNWPVGGAIAIPFPGRRCMYGGARAVMGLKDKVKRGFGSQPHFLKWVAKFYFRVTLCIVTLDLTGWQMPICTVDLQNNKSWYATFLSIKRVVMPDCFSAVQVCRCWPILIPFGAWYGTGFF